jgi:hypothetical protein
MTAGALRLQLLQELAQTSGTPVADVESYFGLKPWRRLAGARRGSQPGSNRGLPVDDLRSQILKRLLAFPLLAREFNTQIAVEFLEGNDPVEQQIQEVWRAATTAGEPSTGALIEALGGSEHVETLMALAAQNLGLDDDLDAARADLAGAFAKLDLRRTQSELAKLAGLPPTTETLERIRELAERQARLKEGSIAPDSA